MGWIPARGPEYGVRLVEDGDDVAGGVPELVGEVAAGADLGLAESAVVAGGGADGEGKAEGVGAMFVDDVQGVRTLPLTLLIFSPCSSWMRPWR